MLVVDQSHEPLPSVRQAPITGGPGIDQGAPKMHSRSLLMWIATATGAALLVALAAPWFLKKPLQDVVSASGRIEGREVTLAPKEIQGRIKTLLVNEGDTVQQGQLVAELQSDQLVARSAALEANVGNLDAQIAQASIDLQYTSKNTEASMAAAEAAVSSARAHLSRAQAVLQNAKVEYDHAQTLAEGGVISKSALDQAVMTYQTSVSDVNAS